MEDKDWDKLMQMTMNRDFSDVDVSEFIVWTEYVNNFHETGRFEPIVPKEEESCFEPMKDVVQKQGCGGEAAWVLLPLFAYRKRRAQMR